MTISPLDGFRRLLVRSWHRLEQRVNPGLVILDKYDYRGCKFETEHPVEKYRLLSWGEEEEFFISVMNEIDRGDVFFDIGSCLGLYSIHAACAGAMVFAFEPDRAFRARLARNIQLNKLETRIRVIDWAVTDHEGEVSLYSDGVAGNSPSLQAGSQSTNHLVRSSSIDSAIDSNELRTPDIIKMDIEGAEILALRGMKRLLLSGKGPRKIFIEFHPEILNRFGSSSAECKEILSNCGYSEIFRSARQDQEQCVFTSSHPRSSERHDVVRTGQQFDRADL